MGDKQNLLDTFDKLLTPQTKRQSLVLFLVVGIIMIAMYYFGYDDVEVGTTKFYVGMFVVIAVGILGIALGRGLKVWYQ